jgi:hypothetical protein
MKTLALVFIFLMVSACGTAVKVQTSGDVEMAAGKDHKLAPLLIQYKFLIPSDHHEFFFWDEDKNRFNVSVKTSADTADGIILYLPADREYALSGFLTVNPSGRWEYSFGENLNMFKVKSGTVNALPYFEILGRDARGFQFRQETEGHIQEAQKKFSGLGQVRQIHVKFIDQ